MTNIIAKKLDAYGVLILGIIAGFFALYHLSKAKTTSDYFLVLLLLLIAYFFIYKAFKTGSLSYALGKLNQIKALANLIKLKSPTFEFDNKMSS
jgi:hypothetical protein